MNRSILEATRAACWTSLKLPKKRVVELLVVKIFTSQIKQLKQKTNQKLKKLFAFHLSCSELESEAVFVS